LSTFLAPPKLDEVEVTIPETNSKSLHPKKETGIPTIFGCELVVLGRLHFSFPGAMLVSVCHSIKNILCLAVTGFLGGGSITNQT